MVSEKHAMIVKYSELQFTAFDTFLTLKSFISTLQFIKLYISTLQVRKDSSEIFVYTNLVITYSSIVTSHQQRIQ